jgi:hypothetical protein
MTHSPEHEREAPDDRRGGDDGSVAGAVVDEAAGELAGVVGEFLLDGLLAVFGD